WQAAAGASTYDVLRTTTNTPPSGVCNCAVATAVSGTTQDDQSNSLNAYTVTTADDTTLSTTLTNEAQSNGVSHLILRQGASATDLSNSGANPTLNCLPKRGATGFVDSAVCDNGTTITFSEPVSFTGA